MAEKINGNEKRAVVHKHCIKEVWLPHPLILLACFISVLKIVCCRLDSQLFGHTPVCGTCALALVYSSYPSALHTL